MICAIDDDGRLFELCRDVGVDEEKTLVRVDGLAWDWTGLCKGNRSTFKRHQSIGHVMAHLAFALRAASSPTPGSLPLTLDINGPARSRR